MIISKIDESLLSKIIHEHIQDLEPSDYEENMTPLEGGLRIEFEWKTIENQCCGDISNYKNWEKLLHEESNVWTNLWIGHPWIYYKMSETEIFLSEYYDVEQKPIEIDIKFKFNKKEFIENLRRSFDQMIDNFNLLTKARISYNIFDIKDDLQNPKGTKVTLKVPKKKYHV